MTIIRYRAQQNTRTAHCAFGSRHVRFVPKADASKFSLKIPKQMVGLRRERRLLEQGAVVRSRF
jgi:hypothetical protein